MPIQSRINLAQPARLQTIPEEDTPQTLHAPSTPASAQADPAAPHQNPPSPGTAIERLRQRMTRWSASGRPLTFTYGIPGTGRSIARALRPGLPEYPAPATDAPALGDLLDEIDAFKATVDGWVKGLDEAAGEVWQRPAPSPLRRLATRAVPWLAPDSVQAITQYSRPDDPRSSKRRGAPVAEGSVKPWDQALATLCQQARRQRHILDRAVEDLDTAMGAVEAADRPAVGDGRARAGQAAIRAAAQLRLEQAQGELAIAREGMHTLLLDSRLQGVRTQRLDAEGDHQLNAFRLSRIDDLRVRGEALKGTLGDRRAQLSFDLALKGEQTRLALDADRALKQAEIAEAQAHYRLQQLRDTTEPGAPALAAAQLRVSEAARHTQQLTAAFEQAVTALAALNTDMGEVLGRLNQADRQQAKVAAAQAPLDAAEVRLRAQPAAAFDRGASQQAMDETDRLFADYARAVITPFAEPREPRLAAALARLASQRDEAASVPPIPEVLLTTVITHALYAVTGDALRAAQALEAIGRQPLAHWLDAGTGGTDGASPAVQENVGALIRTLAPLPRGMDILHLLSSDRATPVDPQRSQALLVFWSADQARLDQRQAGRPLSAVEQRVDTWLGRAQSVARARLRSGDAQPVADVDVAAFHAVANGYVSNAPGSAYDQHDQRLRKASVQWLARAMADRAADAPADGSRLRRLVPTLGKTPFKARTLARGQAVGESMGMTTARKAVDEAIDRRVSDLRRLAEAARGTAPAEADTVEAIIAHLTALKASGATLSETRFGPKAAAKIARHLGTLQHERRLTHRAQRHEARGTLIKAQREPTLPEPYAALCGSEACVFEILERIDDHLRTAAGPEVPARTPDPDSLEQAAALLKREYLGSKDDIVAFFKPLILNCQLRHRLRLAGGGSLGGGVPSLPYSVLSPLVSPLFSAELSRTDEAFVQLFMPILGMEFTIGSTRTHAAEATLGAASGVALAPGVAAQGMLSGRLAGQQATTDGTLMRFFRTRHKDDEMRQNMFNAFDSLVRWDQIAPTHGRAFAGPMEAILARNPTVSISALSSTVSARTLGARVGARLGAGFDDGAGVGQSLGFEPSLYAEAERVRDQRQEQHGHVRVQGQRGDTAQQRAGVTLGLNAQPISNQPQAGGNPAGPTRQGLGLQLSGNRELAWALERHEISPFLLSGNKQDGDLDRHYTSVKDMQADIRAHRDLWLMRCLETLEPDAQGNKDTLANRERADALLRTFEDTIATLAKHNRYCQYNVNYSMKGTVGATLDGYRALSALATRRGDHHGAEQAQAAIDRTLLMKGSWRPLMLIVRERARDSSQRGWRGPLRWQRVATVEGQRTAAQFPPP
jgi:hypothetical protein